MTHVQRCPACSAYESQYKTNNPAVHTLGWSGHGLVIPCEDLGWEAASVLEVHTLGWSGHGLVIPCEDLGWEAACGFRIE